MKKFLLLFSGVAAGAFLFNSCTNLQGHESKSQKLAVAATVAIPVSAPKETTINAVLKTSKATQQPRKGLLTDDELKSTVSEANIGQFILSKDKENENVSTYNGFFGADRYRIEFYTGNVTVDKDNSLLLHVIGKSRYKKMVTPFSGTITIDSAFNRKSYSYEYAEYKRYKNQDPTPFEGDTFTNTVHLKGVFELSQPNNTANTGKFTGNFFMDVMKNDKGEYELWMNTSYETRKAGWLMDGNWASYDGITQKPLLVANDIIAFGNKILKDFSYGEREVEINTAYRKLGWDDYWENDEWWNDSNSPPVSVNGK